MIACKRITALAIFLRGCNQSNPSSISTANVLLIFNFQKKKIALEVISLLFYVVIKNFYDNLNGN